MENAITRDEIMNRLAVHYRAIYDSWYQLMEEAKSAAHDDDMDAHKAITRRADKKSDYMEGIKSAAQVLGIGADEFLDAVNADRTAGQ